MQVVATNAVVNVPIPAGVSGCPVCLISRALANPKPPGCVWLGQKAPLGAGSVAVPLVVGASATGRTPKNWPLEGGQSSVVPFVPMGEQLRPARSPAVQVPLTHSGHGELALPVR